MAREDSTSLARFQRRIGRYEIYGEIAVGGMATVHFARLVGEAGFTRTVAIKRLHQQYAKMPEFVSMFIDEARLAARIQHRNVVATLDTIAEDDELLLVMEYVAGESLSGLHAACFDHGERMPIGVALRVAADALYGLHAAHQATGEDERPLRIVHRDVSPQNVLVGIDGMARVLDFGIAKAVTSVHTTREGELKGKLRYMAPEQIKDGPLTACTDVYGLSVTLWELLTAERLFAASNDAATLAKVLSSTVVKPSRLAPHVPAMVDDIVLRGLHRDAERRFPSAHEMAVALESTGEVALAREVSEWVSRVAAKPIAFRAAAVNAIERAAPSRAMPSTPARDGKEDEEHEPPSIGTITVVDPPRPLPRSRSVSRRWMFVAMGLAVAAMVTAVILRGPARPLASPALASELPTPATASSVVAVSPAESPGALAESHRTADAPAPSAKALSRPTPPRRSADVAKRSCSPPYLEDPSGIRHIKPECLKTAP